MIEISVPSIETTGHRTEIKPFCNKLTFFGHLNWRSDWLPAQPYMRVEIGDEHLEMLVNIHEETPAYLRALADYTECLIESLAEERANRGKQA